MRSTHLSHWLHWQHWRALPLLGVLGCSTPAEKKEADEIALVAGPLVRFVDPKIGTGGAGFGVGSAYPGPATPFGMIHPGPDTAKRGQSPGFNHCSGYYDDDDEILAFSHTRLQGTGVPDLGNIALMPTDGFTSDMAAFRGYRSPFSKDSETAEVGYYAVTLANGDIRVELTTAPRASLHRYTYPEGATATVVVDPTHFIGESGMVETATARVVDGRVEGHVHYRGPMSGRDGGIRAFFVAESDHPIRASQVFDDSGVADGESFAGTRGGLAVTFDGAGEILVRIAVSFVDEAHALENLRAEAPDFDFEAMRSENEAEWESVLGRVRVGGGTEEQQTMFYSALYRAFLMPTLFTESNGDYRGFDGDVHRADGFTYYTDLSLWDTFRTLHPLVTLLDAERAKDFAQSIAKMTEEGGAVPRWPLGTSYTSTMIGSSADIVVADTFLKGVTDFDAEPLYEAMKRQALEPKPAGARGPWRGGIEEYMSLGYVPDEPSVTLEYAYDDWALGNLAEALGHAADAAMLRARSESWRNTWDASAAQVRPRDASGAFPVNFSELAHGNGFVEGNALQWSWYVPHDAKGVLEALGSREAFVARLLELFEKSTTLVPVEGTSHHILPDLYYWHSNEPVIHAAYMFHEAGRADLARKWARHVLDTQYRASPDGLPGNDDGGTMSAWYVWSAMGFYPIAGGPEYWVGRPIFDRIVVEREQGRVEITMAGEGGGVSVNGVDVTSRFAHDAFASSATLRFGGAE